MIRRFTLPVSKHGRVTMMLGMLFVIFALVMFEILIFVSIFYSSCDYKLIAIGDIPTIEGYDYAIYDVIGTTFAAIIMCILLRKSIYLVFASISFIMGLNAIAVYADLSLLHNCILVNWLPTTGNACFMISFILICLAILKEIPKEVSG